MRATFVLLILILLTASFTSTLPAQAVLFDFDTAPLHSSLPIDQTVSGVTAHFSATGQGFSIQEANVLGFTPTGFAGSVIYPNSIDRADLLIGFDRALTDFSIMYSCQELGCDDAATMRVSAYMSGVFVGTNTKTASNPGTWPVDTLGCSFPQGFDSVVVHYDSPPPTCKDYGEIYMADNMRVTLLNVNAVAESGHPDGFSLRQNYPNPFNPTTTIRYAIPHRSRVNLAVLNVLGQEVAVLVDGEIDAGYYDVKFNGSRLASGVYLYRLTAGDLVQSRRMIVVK